MLMKFEHAYSGKDIFINPLYVTSVSEDTKTADVSHIGFASGSVTYVKGAADTVACRIILAAEKAAAMLRR